ncbi:MAG: Crp/Fnr family transcriptional regulator [Veillonella sp.]|nr:Crp/Fnr family transcriptional regulator [Veillonella sp.]MCF0155768.1 Crp/Fnr family transcriptional regulator [Veillonella sp.]
MNTPQVQSIIAQYADTLLASPLFREFDKDTLLHFFTHAQVMTKSYKKHDFVALSGEPMEGLGIVLEGSLLITRENVMGQRVIVTEFGPSAMFGEALLFSKRPAWPATIQTTKASKVLFIPIQAFLAALPECNNCQIKLLTNLLHDMSEKALLLTRKVHYLTLKGMRERIFAYLADMYKAQGTPKLRLPHTRQEMADVLNVSRTAMSRELGRMVHEGLIETSGRTVVLKDLDAMLDFEFEN